MAPTIKTTPTQEPSQAEQLQAEKARLLKEISDLTQQLSGKLGYNVFLYRRDVVQPVIDSGDLAKMKAFKIVEDDARVEKLVQG